MASQELFPDIRLLGIFAIGAIVMRSAGCVINDIIDRKIDAEVARTKGRPLASGALSLRNALWLLLMLLVAGAVILNSLNINAIAFSLMFFIPVFIYPFMKRIMAWPQIFLGITFNAGAIIGWVAVTGSISYPAIAIYVAGFFWTLGYDTIYAHQDKKDDSKIGVKSSALSMNEKTKMFVSLFYLAMVIFLMIAGRLVFNYHNVLYYFSLLIALVHLIWQVKAVDLDNPDDCMRKFRSNAKFGWIVFIGILLEKSLFYF